MLIDLHAHTKGISRCCQIPAPDVLREAKAVGLDGIVLTNHYQESYLNGGSCEEFVERYIREYEYTKELGDRMGMKVFFGVEVTANFWPSIHLLIYGVDAEFLRKYPRLYDYSLEELYEVVRANDCALVQAHPFRNGCHVLDTDFLDGLEINCHPLYGKSYQQELEEAARAAGLILTCGGDFHADTYRPHCGVFLPDWVQTDRDLAKFILTADEVTLHVQEVNDPTHQDQHYVLPRAEKYLK